MTTMDKDDTEFVFSWESWAINRMPNEEADYYGLVHIHHSNPMNISYHNASRWRFSGDPESFWCCDVCQTSPPKEVLIRLNLLHL